MHAYLLIAHNQFELLEKLITALDDERNDLYIHIDAKVRNFDFDYFSSIPKHSRIIFTDRIKVTWGDYSQVKCEMILLKTAVENQNPGNPYSYFHLISGVDFPIKTNNEIHTFFEENSGKEFIHYSNSTVSQSSIDRLKYYHFFRKKRNLFFKIIANILFRFQRFIGVNRLKGADIKVQKGCNWFSITGALAEYIVNNFEMIEKIFRYSYCCDEVFIQTILENSGFKNNLYMPDCHNNHLACARLIDWERGNPYVFRKEDYALIKASPAMFARKFNLNVDHEIVDMLIEKNAD